MSKTSKKKRKAGKKKTINGRISKFITFFVNTGKGTQSAIDAGYSKNGANRTANRLLSNPDILAEIDRLRLEIAKEAGITAQDVINEHAKIAFANSEDFFEWAESIIETKEGLPKTVSVILIKPPNEISRDKKAAISGIKETAQGGLEFKFHDKQKSLDFLGSYFGISNKAQVDKARQIKKAEDQQPNVDPTDGMSEVEIDKALKELED